MICSLASLSLASLMGWGFFFHVARHYPNTQYDFVILICYVSP